MATKTCPNGHKYDSSIYGDNCPFCPAEKTKVTTPEDSEFGYEGRTRVAGNNDEEGLTRPMTNPSFESEGPEEGGTVIRVVGQPDNSSNSANRKLVGLLVSYSENEMGEVYKIMEGRNYIGRSKQNDIHIESDKNMSSKHLMILYREAEKKFWAIDQDSSNGTYINGEFASEKIVLKTNDVIIIGATKFIFLAIPN